MIKQAIVLAVLLLAFASTPCFAHARLQSSTPTANAQLNESPKSLVLNFSETGTLGLLKLVSGGKEIPIPLDKDAKTAKSFTLPLPNLAPGTYSVQWSMVAADDGHLTKGTFTFTISG